MLLQDYLQFFDFAITLSVLGIHGEEGLVEGFAQFVCLIVEGVVEGALIDEAFDGAFVSIPLDLDILHGELYYISRPTVIIRD